MGSDTYRGAPMYICIYIYMQKYTYIYIWVPLDIGGRKRERAGERPPPKTSTE